MFPTFAISNRFASRFALMVCVAALAGGCSDEDERPAEWAFIAPTILAPNCATASCHSNAAAESGLNFSDPKSAYESLLRQQSQFRLPQPLDGNGCVVKDGTSVCSGTRPLVQPCQPDHSRLINTLRGRGTQLMPPDRPLPIADIELIERWILAGAKEHVDDPLPTCASDAGVPAPVPVVDAGSDAESPADSAQPTDVDQSPADALPTQPNDGGVG